MKQKSKKTNKTSSSKSKREKKKVYTTQSLAKIAQKILKPFKSKSKTTNKKPLTKDQQEQLEKINEESAEYNSQQNENYTEQYSSSPNDFFYSHESFFNQFEDQKMKDELLKFYPKFNLDYGTEQEIRKSIIDMLNDSKFMEQFLQSYDMNILDFFKFLFRCNSSIFKGLFLKRIKNAIKYKKYARTIKRSSIRQKSRKHKKNEQ